MLRNYFFKDFKNVANPQLAENFVFAEQAGRALKAAVAFLSCRAVTVRDLTQELFCTSLSLH